MTFSTDLPLDTISSEQLTSISALIDGELLLTDLSATLDKSSVSQFYHYQMIRQTLRGVAITSASHETVAWQESHFAKLWVRVDSPESAKTIEIA